MASYITTRKPSPNYLLMQWTTVKNSALGQSNPIEKLVQLALEKHKNQAYQNTTFFTPSEIRNKICKLPNKKAPSPDGITNNALKHSDNKVTIQVAHIYNECIQNSYFPQLWKNATMIMIDISGKKCKTNSQS